MDQWTTIWASYKNSREGRQLKFAENVRLQVQRRICLSGKGLLGVKVGTRRNPRLQSHMTKLEAVLRTHRRSLRFDRAGGIEYWELQGRSRRASQVHCNCHNGALGLQGHKSLKSHCFWRVWRTGDTTQCYSIFFNMQKPLGSKPIRYQNSLRAELMCAAIVSRAGLITHVASWSRSIRVRGILSS